MSTGRPGGLRRTARRAGAYVGVDEDRRCVLCGSHLSRFNAGTACGPCQRAGKAAVDPAFWADEAVQHAARSWDLGRLVRLYRQHTGLSQTAVARSVNIDQAEVSRLERGKKVIRDRKQLLQWATALAVPSELIGALPQAPGGPAATDEPAVTHLASARTTWEHAIDIARRVDWATSTGIAPEALDTLEQSITAIVARYEVEGPQLLAPEATRLRRRIQGLLELPQPPRQREWLYVTAAKVSALLSYMAVNAGKPELVAAYCAEAFHFAEAVDDVDMLAWIRGTQSLAAYYAGRFAEAVDLARHGQQLAPGSRQSIRLLINGEARALAKLGDRAGTDRAVDAAFTLLDRHAAPTGLTSCISFGAYGRARTAANAATAYVALRDTRQVLTWAEQIESPVEQSDSSWSRALVRLDIATALLRDRQPDVEQAMSLGREALTISSEHPIRSVWQRAHELHGHAERWLTVPDVREYAEALHAWRTLPESQAIAPAD
ncbi:helix-turn-helix domain-containing protein [Streptodolium elevatio]|uniref:Helix-turn-helix transcriptional regulator n=1 Tax=Streptodolium elevatio TaxID=3157996 RepID=A0ABV3D8T4_9ACTN